MFHILHHFIKLSFRIFLLISSPLFHFLNYFFLLEVCLFMSWRIFLTQSNQLLKLFILQLCYSLMDRFFNLLRVEKYWVLISNFKWTVVMSLFVDLLLYFRGTLDLFDFVLLIKFVIQGIHICIFLTIKSSLPGSKILVSFRINLGNQIFNLSKESVTLDRTSWPNCMLFMINLY